jgi:hypothetical protein
MYGIYRIAQFVAMRINSLENACAMRRNPYIGGMMMEQELRTRLFETAQLVTAVTGQSEQAIGQKAIKDNTFFRRLREHNAGFTVKTYDRLMAWMKSELTKQQGRAA